MLEELQRRLEREAKYQGVSINQLTNYLLTVQLSQVESISILESRLNRKKLSALKKKVKEILENVPDREVPEWDSV
jgi:hypothetical protein